MAKFVAEPSEPLVVVDCLLWLPDRHLVTPPDPLCPLPTSAPDDPVPPLCQKPLSTPAGPFVSV